MDLSDSGIKPLSPALQADSLPTELSGKPYQVNPGVGNGNAFQYSCLGNPMGGGAWQATVHGVAKGRTRLSDFTSLYSRRCCFHPRVGKVLWSRKWQPIQVFLPGRFHGQRSLEAPVHGVIKSQTQWNACARVHAHTHTHTLLS